MKRISFLGLVLMSSHAYSSDLCVEAAERISEPFALESCSTEMITILEGRYHNEPRQLEVIEQLSISIPEKYANAVMFRKIGDPNLPADLGDEQTIFTQKHLIREHGMDAVPILESSEVVDGRYEVVLQQMPGDLLLYDVQTNEVPSIGSPVPGNYGKTVWMK